MQISCEKCASQYTIDETRIPPSGMRMQCSKCQHSFQIDRPKPGDAAKGPGSYHVRRRSGRVFGPFLEPAIIKMLKEGTLAGNEDISLDGKNWRALTTVPAFVPHLKAGSSGITDLPAPKATDSATVDLPAPKGSVTGDPADSADLPVPKRSGPTTGLPPLFSDSGSADLPAPKRAGGTGSGNMFDEFSDLPAPRDGGVDLPTPKLGGMDMPSFGNDASDLPAPKRGPDTVGLPAPRGPGGVDLPAPKRTQDNMGLPTPKVGGVDLPAPKRSQDAVDLPTPKVGADLLQPKRPGGLVDLPGLRGDGADLLEPVADSLQPKRGGLAMPDEAPEGGLELDEASDEFEELAREKSRASLEPIQAASANDSDDFDLLPNEPSPAARPPTPIGLPPRPPTQSPLPPKPATQSGLPPIPPRPALASTPKMPAAPSRPMSLSLDDDDGGSASASPPSLQMPGLDLGADEGGSSPLDLGFDSGSQPLDSGMSGGLDISGGGPQPDDSSDSVVSFKAPSPPSAEDRAHAEKDIAPNGAGDSLGLSLEGRAPKKAAKPATLSPDLPDAGGAATATAQPAATTTSKAGSKTQVPARQIPRTLIYAVILLVGLGAGAFLWWKRRRDEKVAAAVMMEKELDGARQLMGGDAPDRYKKAAMLLERVAQKHPAHVDTKVLASLAYLSQSMLLGGDSPTANKGRAFLATATTAPVSPELRKARALKALLAGYVGEARQTFRSLPTDPDALMWLAWTELASLHGKAAEDAALAAEKLKPKRVELGLPLARARGMLGRPEDAAPAIDSMLAVAPEDLRLKIARAMVEPTRTGTRASRVRDLFKGYEKPPLFELALDFTQLARMSSVEFAYGDAEQSLAELTRLNVTLPAAKILQGDLLMLKDKVDEAVPLYDEAVERDRLAPEGFIARARLRIHQAQYSKAEEDLKAAGELTRTPESDKDPKLGDARVTYWVGRLAEAQKDSEKAIASYNLAIEQDPDYLDAYLRKAELLRGKNAEEANKALGQAMSRARKNPRAMLALANAYLDANQPEPAKDALRKAIEADASLLDAHMRLGKLLTHEGSLDDARQAFEAAYRSSPDDPDAAIAYAQLALATNRIEEARKVYATMRGKGDVAPRVLAEALLMEFRAGNLGEVSALREQLVAKSAETASVMFAKGVETMRQRDALGGGVDARRDSDRLLNEAIQSYKSALSIDSRAEFHYALGFALREAKRNEEALQEFAAALQQDDTYAEARAAIARDYMLKKRYGDALAEIEKLVKQRPAVAEYHRMAGDIALESGDNNRAFQAYQEALERDPRDGEVYFRLGRIYAESEKSSKVIESLSKAVAYGDEKRDHWMPEAYRKLGQALADNRRRGPAIAAFKKVIELAPEGTDAEEAERQLAILENQ